MTGGCTGVRGTRVTRRGRARSRSSTRSGRSSAASAPGSAARPGARWSGSRPCPRAARPPRPVLALEFLGRRGQLGLQPGKSRVVQSGPPVWALDHCAACICLFDVQGVVGLGPEAAGAVFAVDLQAVHAWREARDVRPQAHILSLERLPRRNPGIRWTLTGSALLTGTMGSSIGAIWREFGVINSFCHGP
jgi:hypothetical protein